VIWMVLGGRGSIQVGGVDKHASLGLPFLNKSACKEEARGEKLKSDTRDLTRFRPLCTHRRQTDGTVFKSTAP
jgi:hypothetical protein